MQSGREGYWLKRLLEVVTIDLLLVLLRLVLLVWQGWCLFGD